MSGNTFGTLFSVTNFGESHGPAIGCVIDGCPPGMELSEADIQSDLDRRRPGTSKFVTQRNEPDAVQILSGVYQGKTTGTPICLLIQNTDQRSKDYGDILQTFRPGHADYSYWRKYGIRDPRGGGRSNQHPGHALRRHSLDVLGQLRREGALGPHLVRDVCDREEEGRGGWVRIGGTGEMAVTTAPASAR